MVESGQPAKGKQAYFAAAAARGYSLIGISGSAPNDLPVRETSVADPSSSSSIGDGVSRAGRCWPGGEGEFSDNTDLHGRFLVYPPPPPPQTKKTMTDSDSTASMLVLEPCCSKIGLLSVAGRRQMRLSSAVELRVPPVRPPTRVARLETNQSGPESFETEAERVCVCSERRAGFSWGGSSSQWRGVGAGDWTGVEVDLTARRIV